MFLNIYIILLILRGIVGYLENWIIIDEIDY